MAALDIDHQTFSGHTRAADDLLRFVPPSSARVLDIHTGNVDRARMIRERGTEAIVGMMPKVSLPASHDPYHHRQAWHVDDWELPANERDFDCIIVDEVLPRVRNYRGLLWDLRRRISDGGLLVVTLPNIQYHRCVCGVAEGHWQTTTQGVLARENIFLFTAIEGRNLINECGFQTQRIAALVKDEPSVFPRDANGFIRRGAYSIGPLNDAEYQGYLTEYYLYLATPA